MLISLPLTLSKHSNRQWHIDTPLLLPVLMLLSVGFVMIGSASFSFGEYRLNDDLFFLKRHLIYLCLGTLLIFTTLYSNILWSYAILGGSIIVVGLLARIFTDQSKTQASL